jgi:hypothetical protein
MNLSIKLMRDRILNRKDRIRRTSIKQMIINNYLNDNPYDRSIYKYFHIKHALENKICSDDIWEVTKDGFEARTNFGYDYDNEEITFIRHRIVKKGNHYNTNGTDLANRHLEGNREYLDQLLKVQRIIDSYYEMYKEGIEKELAKEDKAREKRLIESSVAYDIKRTKKFILRYGDMGIALLTKWLNKLNDPNRTIEELLEEYLSDTNNAKIYYEAKGDKLYLEGKELGLEFEKELSKELEKYSPRGAKLKFAYLRKISHEKGVIK